MMRGKSGSDQAVIISGLKFFGLVDTARNNEVLPALKDLVSAEGGTTFAQAVAALLDEFEVDVDTLNDDARRTLATLVEKGLVTLG